MSVNDSVMLTVNGLDELAKTTTLPSDIGCALAQSATGESAICGVSGRPIATEACDCATNCAVELTCNSSTVRVSARLGGDWLIDANAKMS
jgi:hypothetical protein